jgi:hypothetical protein
MKTAMMYIGFFLFLAGLSCKKVVNINLNAANPQVVIVGAITDSTGPYQVSINKTVNFSDPNLFPAVSGASVTISDSSGLLLDSLSETSPGIYHTDSSWLAHPFRSYTLQVHTGGQDYRAVSIMPGPVPMDSLGELHSTRGNVKYIEAIPYYQDPPGIHNYYQFTESINGRPTNKIYIFDDRLSDGKYIHEPLFDDSTYSRIQPGDNIQVSMYSIDSATYIYLNTLMQITDNPGIQTSTPANPNTNLTGGALGYFSAHTITTRNLLAN